MLKDVHFLEIELMKPIGKPSHTRPWQTGAPDHFSSGNLSPPERGPGGTSMITSITLATCLILPMQMVLETPPSLDMVYKSRGQWSHIEKLTALPVSTRTSCRLGKY